MNRQELKKAFEENLIDESKYKEELFKIEQQPKKIRKASRLYDPVTQKEFGQLLEITKNNKHRLAFILGFGSGLRLSEIVGGKREDGSNIPALTTECIDTKTKLITLRQAKGRKDRRTMLAKWFKEKHLKLLPIKLSERTLEKSFLKLSLQCGINSIIGHYERKDKNKGIIKVPIYRLKFHSLRRGFITHSLNLNIPPNQVAVMVGHTSLATTTRYAKTKVEDYIGDILEKWNN
jgi:integrase